MLKKPSSIVLTSLRDSPYDREYGSVSSLAAALLETFLNILFVIYTAQAAQSGHCPGS